MIRCRLRELAEEQGISMRQLEFATRIRLSTLLGFRDNTWKHFPAYAMDRLCEHFGVTPGELLEYVKEEGAGEE